MNLNFCVKWLRQIASGADKSGKRKAETGKTSDSRITLFYPLSGIRYPTSV